MFPPAQGLRLDIDAISQIFGSIGIACWIVVFSPQIVENWRRGSADGLSVMFLVVWLLGDVFNILGAVLQGVLPTMVILGVYYAIADVVLLLQCFWYKGFTLRDEVATFGDDSDIEDDDDNMSPTSEQSPLLSGGGHVRNANQTSINDHDTHQPHISDVERRFSGHSLGSSFRERYLSIDGTHLSPATPLLDNTGHSHSIAPNTVSFKASTSQSAIHSLFFNIATVLLVCAAGVFGWYLSARNTPPRDTSDGRPCTDLALHFNLWGQIFGYICAALYLGSRVPQLLLNYRRKSTDGISMLFFLFACLGNLTYVLSIVVYKPVCSGGGGACVEGEAQAIYWRYLAVNLSWLVGSFGTLILDAGVFVQYFMYRDDVGW